MNGTAIARWSTRGILAAAAAASLVASAPAAPPAPQPTEGEQLIIRQDWDAAEEHYYDRIKANPEDAEALRKLGFIELRRPGGDAVRAAKYLEKARSLEPDNPVGLFLLGRTYDVLDRKDLALRAYDRLLEMGPGRDDPQRATAVHLARFARAIAALERGETDRAQQLFDEVLRREKKHGYVYYERAMLAAREGRTDEAIALYEKTLEMLNRWAPTEAWPYPQARYAYIRENTKYDLARLLIERGENTRAITLLEPIVQTVQLRADSRRRPVAPAPKSPLEGKPDVRFENAPLFYAKALAAEGRTKEARAVLKDFYRSRVGDDWARDEARRLYKELR
ncbi:MAG: hypothetical protein Kow0062_11930 [Acidobacteriota bacterium]